MVDCLVSVVIPAFNREATLERAIDSVLCQTYKQIECIVVDDCSTDKTPEIVNKRYSNDDRVVYHRLEKNSGACVARNKGVALSKGKYVAFLDSDDKYRAQKIELQVKALEETGSQFCASGFVGVGIDGTQTVVKQYTGSKKDIFNKLLYLNNITTGVLCGLKDCLLETPFDENQPRYQDWDLALRLFKKYNFIFIDYIGLELIRQPVSISSSTSHKKTLKALQTIYKKNKVDYDMNKKAYSQIHWLMGLHSVYIPGEKDLKSLWKGVVGNGFSFHRLGVFIALNIGLKKHFLKTIQNI